MTKRTFYSYFKESMDSLGLPAPVSLFTSVTTATGSISVLLEFVAKYGDKVTFREIIKTAPAGTMAAALGAEVVKVVAACTVAFYVGACIGALAYATGQYSADNLWAANTSQPHDLIHRAIACGVKVPAKTIPSLSRQLSLLEWKTASLAKPASRSC